MNAISIDLEDWWCNEYLLPHLQNDPSAHYNDMLIESVKPVLDILNKSDTLATFFILGSTASRYPDLIKEIHDRGHEIACHGYSHKPLYKLSKEEFGQELEKCQMIIGKYSPRGFRAPSFSLNNNTKWAIDILSRFNYKYDSSVFPTWTPLYGSIKAPKSLYKMSSIKMDENDPDGTLYEVPLTVTTTPLIGFPCAGGFYLRLIPEKILVKELLKVERHRPVILYVHPWETNINIPKIDAGPIVNFEANYSKKSVMRKLNSILKNMKFGRIDELVEEYRNFVS
jgi:peptidoglycan-N-acetylglucosamine deacetylase